ncbi:unnamed protein product, partial [Rotaria sp. Silwood1]
MTGRKENKTTAATTSPTKTGTA